MSVRKLIEVALPLDAINTESLRRKQKAPKGWPTSFHKWWAQRPLATARAVIFAQMVDDPSSHLDLFPTKKAQDQERKRLFEIIEQLILWDNTNNRSVLERAQSEIHETWRRSCKSALENSQPLSEFDETQVPPFLDPFSGSGSLPLSAQWLGIESFATDLNPVAVLINKATIEVPALFAGVSPVNPTSRQETDLVERKWRGASGIANDVRFYGNWLRDEATKQLNQLYPAVRITEEMSEERPDLSKYVGQELKAIAWLWARTVRSPNPAFSDVHIPLISTFILSSKKGKEVYLDPVVSGNTYEFSVRVGKPPDLPVARKGTSAGKRKAFNCLVSGVPVSYEHIRTEARAGRMGVRLMAAVTEGHRGRVYLSPTRDMERIAESASPSWKPDCEMPKKHRDFKPPGYGMYNLGDIFTDRQLVALTTFSDLVQKVGEIAEGDAINAGMSADKTNLAERGRGATAYGQAICMYLACAVDRMVYYGSSLTSWLPKDNALRDCMPRQVLAMTWDFAECNPLGKSSGDVTTCVNAVANYLDMATPNSNANVEQRDARSVLSAGKKYVISTDPPYYDNINYADLSDYFYVWLRRTLRSVFPDLFATLSVPKAEELVATPHRHGNKANAEKFFLEGMTEVMHQLALSTHPAYPVSIYYAFKQSESSETDGTTNTGWDTFLDAVVRAGFSITGTWPIRTEGAGRMIASGTNALASSIVLICRPRASDARAATRREFISALKEELPGALIELQAGNIAPVDLAQAAIGPGMAVFTRFAQVLDAEGQPLQTRQALAIINETLDEVLTEQEGDFDADTRWALTWFEQSGFAEGEYGVAEQLSKSKNTSVRGLVEAGILASNAGDVRLLRPDELTDNWDPTTDTRLTVWETVHYLIRILESDGEAGASELVAKLGSNAEVARELCYRLYTMCERKKRAREAMSYNALVQSWSEIQRLAREVKPPPVPEQGELI